MEQGCDSGVMGSRGGPYSPLSAYPPGRWLQTSAPAPQAARRQSGSPVPREGGEETGGLGSSVPPGRTTFGSGPKPQQRARL